jgi:hypothetical protein
MLHITYGHIAPLATEEKLKIAARARHCERKQHLARPGERRQVAGVLVDTGAAVSCIPAFCVAPADVDWSGLRST